jgi:hypothetical protein
MALFKICRGAEINLPTTLTSGYCYFCTDTTNFYIDYTDTYGALTRAKIASKYADKLRYTEDGNFIELDPTDLVTKSNYETAIGVATSDKNGLMSSSDKTKLDGVESGAQVNVQSDYFQNDTTATDYIKNRTHHSEPYTAIPSAEPVDLLQRSIGDIIRLDNQAANGAIIVQVINSLGTRYGGVRAAIRETTYNTDFEKVHTHDWDCSDINVTIEEIGHHPKYEELGNKLCHIVRGSVELYVVYFIAYPAYLNDEYKTQFPEIGIYLKYIAKPVYASQYLNVSLVTTRYYSLSRHYLPQNVENTDNRVIAISAESDDTHYPTAKAVYDALPTIVSTDSNGLMSSVDKSKLDGIEAGAEVNVQADWNQSDTTAKDYIKNKICYDFSGWKTTFSQLLKTDADNMFISSYYPDYTYAYSFVKKNLEEGSTVKIAIDDSSIDFVVPVSDEAQWGEYTIGDYQIALFGGTGNYGHFIVAMGCKTDISGSTFSIQQYVNETKTIDEKYLPTYLDKLAYCTCATDASIKAKVATCSVGQFTLTKGQKAVVKFSYANTAVGPTLNIGSTGAKTIYWHGQVLPSTQYWEAGAVLEFVYNGSQFELIGIAKDNSKEYSVATASSDGLFSATDKAKLDGISSGATAVSIDTTLTQSGQAADAKAVGDELAKKLDNPQTAAVGDVLTVEEVDGDGKPTKWKSVDANAVLTIDNTGYKGTDYYALPDGVYNLLSLYVANKDGMNLRLQGVTSVKNHSFVCAGKNTTVIFGSDGSVVGYDYGVWRWDEKENVSNKVTSLSATSKDSQYPSAKAVYDTLTTAIPTTLPNPNKLTFSGAVTGEYDGSSAVAIEIPKGGKASANFLIQPNGTVLSAPTYVQLTSGAYASFYALYGGTLYALSQQTQTSGTFTFKFNDVPNGKMYVVTVDSSDNTTFAEEDLPTTTVTLKTWTSADIS